MFAGLVLTTLVHYEPIRRLRETAGDDVHGACEADTASITRPRQKC